MAAACRQAAGRLEQADEAAFSLQYPSSALGAPTFLSHLAGFLREAYGGPVLEDGLCTTNGVSHGLDLCCAALTSPGDAVWMEVPTYFLAHQIFVDHRLVVRGVPTDEYGLDVDALAAALTDGSRGAPPRLLYIVPSHGNPTGAVLPLARRKQLLRLARAHNFIVVCDDVYHLLDWTADGTPPPRLLHLDADFQRRVAAAAAPAKDDGGGDGGEGNGRPQSEGPAAPQQEQRGADAADEVEDDAYTNFAPRGGAEADVASLGCVVSIGSFTKILSPALRLGWLEASPALLAKVAARGYLVSGGAVAPFAAEVVGELLTTRTIHTVLAQLNADYAASASRLCAALTAHGFEITTQPYGGFFVWVRLPDGLTAQAVLPLAEKHGVVFLPGPVCAPHGPPDACARHMRLCFACESVELFDEGVRRLAAAVAEAGAEQRPAKAARVAGD